MSIKKEIEEIKKDLKEIKDIIYTEKHNLITVRISKIENFLEKELDYVTISKRKL